MFTRMRNHGQLFQHVAGGNVNVHAFAIGGMVAGTTNLQ